MPVSVLVLQEGRKRFSAEPSPEDMTLFWQKSPIAHVSKVRGPMIFMLGAKDRRVSVTQLTQCLLTERSWFSPVCVCGGGGTFVSWHPASCLASCWDQRTAG